MKFGILDFGRIPEKKTAEDVLDNLFETVRYVESIGYSRYWLGEHYTSDAAWRNPEVLIGLLAGYTNKIKVGAAGIILAVNNPLRIAQSFKLLGAVFPDRIDLGIARGTVDEATAKKLLDGNDLSVTTSMHIERLKSLVGYLSESYVENAEENPIIIPPFELTGPNVWIMAGSANNIPVTVETKSNFCFSTFHTVDDKAGPDVIKEFKERYFDKHKTEAKCCVAVAGICGDSEEEVQNSITKHSSSFVKLSKPRLVLGARETFKEQIEELSFKYGVDEFIFYEVSDSFDQKSESYTNVSEIFKLNDLKNDKIIEPAKELDT